METITRSEFDLVPPRERMKMMLEGKVKLVDDPVKPRPERPEGSILRSDFDKMNAKERWDAMIVKKKTLYHDL